MPRYILLILGLAYYNITFGQLNIGGLPYSIRNNFTPSETIPSFIAPEIDPVQIAREDSVSDNNGFAPRFGKRFETQLTLENSGLWTDLSEGGKLWQLEIICSGALSVNLLFDQFWLPPGSELYLYSKDRTHIIGGFTDRNNKGNNSNDVRGFGTGLVYNDTIIIEYYESAETSGKALLAISDVVHGYRYIPMPVYNEGNPPTIGASGSCQVNVNCSPEGDNWQREKSGVALIIVNGEAWCTGSLINNTCRDGDLLFLTAEHCTRSADLSDRFYPANPNADIWSFFWFYESPTCGTQAPQIFDIFITNGATLLAEAPTTFYDNSSNPKRLVNLTDFALFRLQESPLEVNPNIMFNGWSIANTPLNDGVGIHHPSGDLKKIATHNMTPFTTGWGSGTPPEIELNNKYWYADWQATPNGFSVTEGGSSGSPLFMKNGLIIGQLRGSATYNCESPGPAADNGFYGKLNVSWDFYPNPVEQLKYWLDPCGTGQQYVNGGFMVDECIQDLFVTQTVVHNRTFQATDHIYANSIIPEDIACEMYAGQKVILQPGFKATNGSNFWAHVDPCETNVVRNQQTNGYNLSLNTNISSKVELDNSDKIEYSLYPNPTSHYLNVVTNSELQKMFIYDQTGKLVYQMANSSTRITTIDISFLSNGMYIIELQLSGMIKRDKFIVN